MTAGAGANMGLFDALNTDDGRFGLGLLAAVAPRTDGAGFGQRLNEAVGSVDQFKRQKLLLLQELQMQEAESLADKQAQRAQAQQMQGAVQAFCRAWGRLVCRPFKEMQNLASCLALASRRNPGDTTTRALPVPWRIDPRALQIQQSLQKDKVNKPDVGGTSDPSSVAEVHAERQLWRSGSDGQGARCQHRQQDRCQNPFTGQPPTASKTRSLQTMPRRLGQPARPEHDGCSARDMQRFTAEQAGKTQFHDGHMGNATQRNQPVGVAKRPSPVIKSRSDVWQKSNSGIESLNGAIGEYVNNLQSWNKPGALSPDARAEMGNQVQQHDAAGQRSLQPGVLNGPDFQILQSVVTDPRSLTGAFTSKKSAGEASFTEPGRITEHR